MATIAPSRRALAFAVGCALVGSLASGESAHAQIQQEGFALDQFHPAPAGDRFFAIQGAEAEGHARLKLMLLAEYARDPLVISREGADGESEELGAVVSDQLVLHVGAALPLFNRVLLSIDMPMALVNTGDRIDLGGGEELAPPEGVSPGDLRLGARLKLLGIGPIHVALAGYAWLPTGEEQDFTGAGSVRGSPQLVVSGKMGTVVYGVHAGVLFAPEATYAETTVGHQLVFGGAVAWIGLRERLQIGPELYGSSVMSGDDSFCGDTTGLELLLGAKYRLEPVIVGGGIGPGLGSGIGTATVRAVASVAYAPIAEDRDHDGILDEDDRCPDRPGTASREALKHGCPEEASDRDKDGLGDAEDACPDHPGPRTASRETNGCPDRDADAIPDQRDACPAVDGVRTDDPKTNGCPPDRDNDGVLDQADACPDVAGEKSPRRKRNGCPPDRDGDGISDLDDVCPEVRGVDSSDPALKGCPPDSDGDTLTDDKDACPKEQGAPDPDRRKSGCPVVFATAKTIELRGEVQFRGATDVILPESDELLGSVAKLLSERPEILKVQIVAHTDEPGGKAASQNLSARRAASVKKWLTTRGKIDAKRIDTRGAGAERPLDTSGTEEGRKKNRRIEIEITERQKPAPALAPKPRDAGDE